MGTHSNQAHEIAANIALLWGRLLSCSVEIREHLTGSGLNMGESLGALLYLFPGDPGTPEWHMS